MDEVNKNLSEQLETLQNDSLKNNLMFFGAEEEGGEDCIGIIKNICSTFLDIGDDISISSAFRLGKKPTPTLVNKGKQQNRRPRPIVIKFVYRQQRDYVRKNLHKLKDTPISISEHFPKSIHDKRKLLFPIYKKAKDEGKKATLIRDKLYIDGEQTLVKGLGENQFIVCYFTAFSDHAPLHVRLKCELRLDKHRGHDGNYG